MNNSMIYALDADAYYTCNAACLHAVTTDHLLATLDHVWLKDADVAEFGIGNGLNLFLIREYCRSVTGFDIGEAAVENFRRRSAAHPTPESFAVHRVNLAEPFDSGRRFDLLLYGFFAYYCDDGEMETVRMNMRNHLKAGGILPVVDFLVRENRCKPDIRNQTLKVYKRSLPWWISQVDLSSSRFRSARLPPVELGLRALSPKHGATTYRLYDPAKRRSLDFLRPLPDAEPLELIRK